jgi:hypothetical protein
LIKSVLQSLPIYTFSCFEVPGAVCKKLDSMVNAFWWGHDPGTKKLHLVGWETLSKPKKEEGLGINKFSLINQAMVTKQY